MGKLLVVCGPTAIGKTSLAIHLAKVLDGEVLSADSRQVYKGMDIGTGKDLPPNARFISENSKTGGYYLLEGVRLWGYDLASPKAGFSVGEYSKLAKRVVDDILSRNKLPIIVGGTGLYVKAIIDSIPTASIVPNKSLREKLEAKSTEDLFESLAQLDSVKAGQMNQSDKKNPRRLVRAIEIAQWKIDNHKLPSIGSNTYDTLFIGLRSSLPTLFERVTERIHRRIADGFEKEVKELVRSGVSLDSQAFDALGYKQWNNYLGGRISREEALTAWENEEKAYIKRQLTWFKREQRIRWFDISTPHWQKRVESVVKKWHNTANNHASKN